MFMIYFAIESSTFVAKSASELAFEEDIVEGVHSTTTNTNIFSTGCPRLCQATDLEKNFKS